MHNPSTHALAAPSALRTPVGRKYARLILGCILLPLLAGGAYAKPLKWQYRVVNASLNERQLETLLNRNAAEGWELVQITHRGVAIFKRLK